MQEIRYIGEVWEATRVYCKYTPEWEIETDFVNYVIQNNRDMTTSYWITAEKHQYFLLDCGK